MGLIDKREVIDNIIEIEVKVEKTQALIKVMKSFPDTPKDNLTLLDIINDYANQILGEASTLIDLMHELFNELKMQSKE